MKSCLKSPPLSPEQSPPSSPSGSGSPLRYLRPHPHKTVSFCSEDCLEEVFVADEWDRSPAPVTPRLSYQDVLELKQLRLSLPRTPPSPSFRQPFTTSLPDAYASSSSENSDSCSGLSSASFPVSRLASQPSQTPSRWKNRPQPPIDPDILPYLDAVPIRLLPLLDAYSPTPEPDTVPTSAPVSTCPDRSASSFQPLSVPPPQVPPPRIPPAIHVPTLPQEPTRPASPSDSPTTPTSVLPPPRRTLNFAFLPLLPVDPSPPVPLPVLTLEQTPKPKRLFNMTFVTLAAPVEPSISSTPEVPPFVFPPSLETSASNPPSPIPTARVPLMLTLPPQPRSTAPTPLLSPSSPDVDADTDSTVDTDTESDAPSTGTAESIPSPTESEPVPFPTVEDGYFAYALQELRLGDAGEKLGLGDVEDEGGKRRTPAPGPGTTPPLSALYPSPRSQAQHLRAITSAALIPPSPFSLGAPAMMSKRMWGWRLKGEDRVQDDEEGEEGIGGEDRECMIPPSITRRSRQVDVGVRA
ncbi:hypothetical protein SCP_0901870 [Sparassis crispa]|uniref:Uncharacterized protein n=1 Tax=Sparassis crispa TaxID=139825 RepID=A0A401GVQ4_9APHY|nr:hypothetical protein SCP_0901870 [Sparassis crispa]GBE86308.1 hypothetical protein SCP_0901870 [Sparassis crispa]